MSLRRLLRSLYADLRPDTDRGQLVRSTGATAMLKVGATVIAFGASLVYARALAPHGYGLYAYVAAWVGLVSIPASLGLPLYLVREGAKMPASIRRLCRWADVRILAAGTAAAVLLGCALFLPQAAGARWLFVIAAPIPLLNNLGHIRRSLLQDMGWVARGQWPYFILGPGLMLAALAGLWLYQGRLYPIELVAALTGAALFPLLINQFQFRKVTREEKITVDAPLPPVRVRSALPFMWLGVLYLVNSRADLIMLGSMRGAHAAGVYAVASRAGELVIFLLMATNMVISPHIARFYHQGDHERLQRLITAAVRRIFVLSLPLALLFFIVAGPLLTYLYGPGYSGGAVALQILTGAQLVNVLTGPTDIMLNMTDHERLATYGAGLGAIVNIILDGILIPFYGIEGAAFATACSLVAWNILLWYWVRKRLNVRPTVFGF